MTISEFLTKYYNWSDDDLKKKSKALTYIKNKSEQEYIETCLALKSFFINHHY